jgi:hypothetical protein
MLTDGGPDGHVDFCVLNSLHDERSVITVCSVESNSSGELRQNLADQYVTGV